jgi:hypothetical protein
MTRLFGVIAILLLAALVPVGYAQDHVSRASITLTEAVVVGTTTVEPGEYRFECKDVDGQHFMIVSREGKEVTRTQCNRVELNAKIKQTSHRTMMRENTRIMTELRINGETFAHRLVP